MEETYNSRRTLRVRIKKYSEVSQKKYIVWDRFTGSFKDKSKATKQYHGHGGTPVTQHHKNEKRLVVFLVRFFIYLFYKYLNE